MSRIDAHQRIGLHSMADCLDVVAVSGGKDSTAMALRLRELAPAHPYVFLTTPTGDELPEMAAHMERLRCTLGPIESVTDRTLAGLIEHFDAVPNGRMRWCTRMLKIEPCIAWIRRQDRPVRLHVGLRADEPERQGLYSELVQTVFPMRDWQWGVEDVRRYLAERGVTVPRRTDCARCYAQRLGEWWDLWKFTPEIYADAERDEDRTGHTFRTPGRDTWPVALRDLRAEFERGKVPVRSHVHLELFDDEDDRLGACRVCTL